MRLSLLGAIAAALALAGCATAPIAPPSATMETLRSVQASGIRPIQVGVFRPGPGLPPGRDEAINSRAIKIKPLFGGSFSGYLKLSLATELNAAGKLDANSPLEVTGLLTESELHSASFKTGSASIAARFVMTRDRVVIYDKQLRVESSWRSNPLGGIAIPAAINGYNSLYPRLVRALLEDPEFVAAARS
ncbi:MAG: hypothetical protein GC145_14820 [Caulobacter sp.]|nr:hypothetical protein [Caulobacter sp.]